MKKKIWIPILVVLILIIASATIYFMPKKAKDFNLQLKSGEVNVLLPGEDWTKITQTENSFKKIESVQTKKGEGVLKILKSTIITLKPNSQIQIEKIADEKITVFTNSGNTWHKFLNIGDVKEYVVKTPQSEIIVSGTSFKIDVNETQTELLLVEGTIDFANRDVTLEPLDKIILYNDNSYELGNLTPEEKTQIITQTEETLNDMKNVREEMINEYSNIVSTIQKLTNTTDEDLELTLQDIDAGLVDDKTLMEQSPVPLPDAIDELINLNDEMKSQIELINRLKE